MALSQRSCIPCREGADPLSQEKITRYLLVVNPDWKHENNPDKIVRVVQSKNFKEALAVINTVGDIAESEGHHPNLSLYDYKFVRIELWTHKINGLHENDFILYFL